MKIDLSNADLFESNELDLNKQITFIFGKNGTGKSTITNELKKLSSDYNVSIFSGFLDLLDDNRRLNAVILGEENNEINKQIKEIEIEIREKQEEIEEINKSIQEPKDPSTSNIWSKKETAKSELNSIKNNLESLFTKLASNIKNLSDPVLAAPTYNKKKFIEDMNDAMLLSDDELQELQLVIKSEIKEAVNIDFPKIDFKTLKSEVDSILEKSIIERTRVSRLENSVEKREFAKKGYELHKKGDICAFCGNHIDDSTWDELDSYFSVDDIKLLKKEIINKLQQVDSLINEIKDLSIDNKNFYPKFRNELDTILNVFSQKKEEALIFLTSLKNSLDEKQKYLFEKYQANLKYCSFDNFDEIKCSYEDLRERNNSINHDKDKEQAKNKIRKHYVKKYLNESYYDDIKEKKEKAELNYQVHERLYNSEKEKIEGQGGLKEIIKTLRSKILSLQKQTKSETELTQRINDKLKNMVSFELVHVQDKGSKGFYNIKDSNSGVVRDINELSTGEKNIIAFLYFIEKLAEIKEEIIDKTRIIVFDDPMNSNDDGMQYLIIEELQNLMKKIKRNEFFILMTHNKHFYLNVKYGHKYDTDQFIRFQRVGNKTRFFFIDNSNDDYKTSYEELWQELKILYGIDSISPAFLLNPIRRIIETFTKFNGLKIKEFCNCVEGSFKLFNVNSHSIDDLEAELNGKNKDEIIKLFFECFNKNKNLEHFYKFGKEFVFDDKGKIIKQ